MMDFTVAICTYNGESRLSQVLEKLLQQTNTDDFTWEIIVIDNNSSDKTSEIVKKYQQNWKQPYPLKYYFETRQGLAYARRLAINKAEGELVGFLDDDNLPNSDWVAAAFNFGQSYPQAGAYGSKITAKYEIKPPANFEEIGSFLAIIERGNKPLRYNPQKWIFPAGAGLVIRQQAWLENVPKHPQLTGVCGKSLQAKGEDIETLSYIIKSDWQVWYNPAMSIEHYIPKSRLQKDYLIKLFRGVGLSSYILRKLRFSRGQLLFMFPVYFLNDVRKLIVYSIKHHKRIQTDIVTACFWELYKYKLLSPFYHWSRKDTQINS